jgi:hypothetical protein
MHHLFKHVAHLWPGVELNVTIFSIFNFLPLFFGGEKKDSGQTGHAATTVTVPTMDMWDMTTGSERGWSSSLAFY